ncbi:MAG: SMP-30/gluconolactonase/LRE family protein [Acidobacteriota bacterium]
MDIVCVSSASNDLGESLYWDFAGERLYWIDAWRTKVYAFDPATMETRCTDLTSALAGLPIGSIACHGAGGMIGGVRGGFYHLDLDGGSASLIAAVESDRPSANRLNDGKCDRVGRFWCASANTDHRTPTGALWRLEAGGAPVLMLDGLIVGNGIAWSVDDRLMYVADTFAGTVWQHDFDVSTGEIVNRRPFISTAHIRGAIDGATVDADGCYWAALFRGGAIAQFDPEGKLIRHIGLPISNPTTCAFGGPSLDVLYVTSASRFLDEAQLRAQPLAGRVFAIHGLGARGLPEPRFGA